MSELSELLQQLAVPYQRKGEAWLVEVGGAWATFATIPRDGSVVGFLMHDGRPAPSPDLVRANAEPGLAWHHTGVEGLLTRVAVPAADLGPTGLGRAIAALRVEAGGDPEPPLEEALPGLDDAPKHVAATPHGDFVDLRIELETGHGTPDEAMAEWMLEMSALCSARLGVDAAGTLCAIAAVPAPARGLPWGVEQLQELERLYRAA